MSGGPDEFRDFGILPHQAAPPAETVRAYFPLAHVIGQYLFTFLISVLGIGMGIFLALKLPSPGNILMAAVAIVGTGYVVYRATHNDYAWVELDKEKLRAKHLYTRREIERSIDEIEDLLTLVFQVRTFETRITDAWLGRVRGIMIRFRDKRTPSQVCRTDPKMKNAKELIEAIVYRMSEKGAVDAEIIDFEGKPLIRRIHWKKPASDPSA